MKISPVAILLSIPFCLCASPSSAESSSDSAVGAVAKASLPGYLAQIPVGQESRYGFQDRQELSHAVLGTPIAVYGVRSGVADSAPALADSLWSRPFARGTWRVPVKVDGKPRAYLTVEANDGVLQSVDFGGAVLAQEIGAFEQKNPGARTALLRLDGLMCDVLLVDRTGNGFDEGEYRPLRSARSVFLSDTTSFRSRKDAFEAIRRRIRQKAEVRP